MHMPMSVHPDQIPVFCSPAAEFQGPGHSLVPHERITRRGLSPKEMKAAVEDNLTS